MSDRFDAMTKEFEARIRAAHIDGDTEIHLIFHWLDASGREIHRGRESIGTLTKVSGGPSEVNEQFAASFHLGGIIENMRRLVLDAPKTPTVIRGRAEPVYVRDIELEITPS